MTGHVPCTPYLARAVIHSPPAAASPVASLAEARAGLLRAGSGATPPAALGGPFSLGALNIAAEAAPSGPAEERVESRWQLVEELLCPLVAVSPGGGSDDTAAAAAAAAPALQPLRGEAVLPAGPSVLTFLAAPVKRGLYKALHLRAALQQLPLHVAVRPPAPLWPAAGAAGASATSVAAGAAGSRAEEVVMLVEQAQPRVQLSLLAAGGGLIAGQEQWLGLLLAPERDTLHGARLELSWPLSQPPAARGLAGEQAWRRWAGVLCPVTHTGAACCWSAARGQQADVTPLAPRLPLPPQACRAKPLLWRLRTARCSRPIFA